MRPPNLTCCCCHNPIVGSPTWVKIKDAPYYWSCPRMYTVGVGYFPVALICANCDESYSITIDHITEWANGEEILHPLKNPVSFNKDDRPR